ncbi:AAEL009429-PA, partial [Aedes aegypti]
EIDVTLKGNQWPLSCFGPFKERNCVPNFIEDVSFEEIRMMYLEAKMQNNIAGHQMQLMQMINEAKQKMQWLGTTNRDIMNTLIEIYNQQDDSAKPTTVVQPQTANPFGAAPLGGGNVAATASIFGGGTTGGGFGTAGGGFGASAVAAGGGGNIFGAAPNQSAANIFGSGGAVSTMGGNIFAKPAQAPTGGTTGTTAAASGNLFAQPFGQQTQGQNLFASAPTQAQPTASPFVAAPAPPTNNPFASPFAAAQPQQNLFGTALTASQQAQTAPPPPFGQSVQQQPATQSLFIPAPQAVQPQSASTMVGTQQQPMFGSATVPGVFGGIPQQQTMTMVSQSATIYSRMEDLSKDQLAAFSAERFELGKIPTVPPPRELCN